MNIVVIGGGEPGKFGNDFCVRAKSEGHNVYILSHQDYGTQDPNHYHTDFSERQLVVDAFRTMTADVENIDIFLYNTHTASYPNHADLFKSTAQISSFWWSQGIYYNVALAHVLSVEALKKMSAGSKLVFMASRMGIDFDRTEYTEYAGYAGLKAAQIHLMIALSHHNDKGAIATTVCPHFPYDEPGKYPPVLEKVYDYILNFTENSKVKIIH
jgi:NAD(P)-dependent dehydrogenase (short-subunit alcohol dehydrogenase family)